MEYPIYNALGAGRFAVEPNFLKYGGVQQKHYLSFLASVLPSASVIDGTSNAIFHLRRQAENLDDWKRLPPIKPRRGLCYIEVDLSSLAGLVEHRYSSENLASLQIGWAALVTTTSAKLIPGARDWAPRRTSEVLCIDVCMQWRVDGPLYLPIAQYFIPLDSRGYALEITDRVRTGCWVASSWLPQEDSQQLELFIQEAIFPILVSLAAENGEIPEDLRNHTLTSIGSNYAIRRAIIQGKYTSLDEPASVLSSRGDSTQSRFIEEVATAPYFDASLQAREYLLDELNPNYDLRSLPPLTPPGPLTYIEVEPPDRFLTADGIVRPFSWLVGAGVRWSALVRFTEFREQSSIMITLNVQDAQNLPPRCNVAVTNIALGRDGRAQTESGVNWLVGPRAKEDQHNQHMWLQPIVRRLAAFNI